MTPGGSSLFALPERSVQWDYEARFVIVVEADIPPGMLAVTWHVLSEPVAAGAV